MKLLLPILLAVVGIAVGGAVGIVLKPAPEPVEETAEDAVEPETVEEPEAASGVGPASDSVYVALSRKLIVPFTRDDGRKSFVAIDITLEMDPDKADWATEHEPKILDAFLRTMISFAATGAFDDHTAASHTLQELDAELLKAARAVLGAPVREVLISNLLTQDA